MSDPFLDTNIFLRHILNDDPVKSPACFALIRAIERGETTVWTSELAIAEVVFVLESKRTYNVPRDTIRDVLLPLLSLPGIKLPHKR
jgi:predicted nucleic acid-binding protein